MTPKSMSQEAIRKVFEEMFEDRVKDLEKAKGKWKEGECDSDREGKEGVEEGTPRQEVELSID